MQPWVLLTNYHRYVDQFVHWGLRRLREDPTVAKVVLPGNVVIDRSLTPEEAEIRVDGRGLAPVPDAGLPSRA